MSKIKNIAVAAALLAGASSLAMAPAMAQGMNTTTGSTQQNAAASGGAGTHSTAVKTGTASNNQKVLHNQNGYQGRQ